MPTATNRRLTPNSTPVNAQKMAARPRGDDYGYTGLKAVPRHANDPNWSHGYYYPKRSHYVAAPHHYYYNHYYYYPHHVYPYGYGAWGLGYFYYNPYAWAPVAHIHYDGYSYGYGYGYSTGELRLQVRPSFAEVYVDGYYAGQVDEFDGSFQSLRLEEGEYPHRDHGGRIRHDCLRRSDSTGTEDHLPRRAVRRTAALRILPGRLRSLRKGGSFLDRRSPEGEGGRSTRRRQCRRRNSRYNGIPSRMTMTPKPVVLGSLRSPLSRIRALAST